MQAYENGKDTSWAERTKRSMQSRVQTIEKATKKLHACIKQCENRHQNGVSNDDIFNQAKLMVREDPLFKTDHDEDVIGESPSQRPRGMKKSKLKRKLDDQTSAVINSLEKGNKQLLEKLNQTNAQREHHFEIQKKNYALKELKEENKMLFLDLNSVQDPNIRAYIQAQQAQILQNRSLQQQAQQAPPPSTSFGQYFNNFNGSGGDLPDY
ncbi:hypothetical protein YC2023_076484 [Brassica napus]